MSTKGELMAGGLPAELANKLGFDVFQTLASAGTTQGTAAKMVGNCVNVTTVGANSGIIILSNGTNFIFNGGGGNVLTVYPPVGGTILGLAKNGGLQVANGKAVTIFGDGLTFLANLSA